jgi:hypothetical protein
MIGKLNRQQITNLDKLTKTLQKIIGEVNTISVATKTDNVNNIPQEVISKNKDEGFDLAWTHHAHINGREITVDMFNAIRDLEVVTGNQYIYTDTTTKIRKPELTDEIESIKKLHKKVKDLEDK